MVLLLMSIVTLLGTDAIAILPPSNGTAADVKCCCLVLMPYNLAKWDINSGTTGTTAAIIWYCC